MSKIYNEVYDDVFKTLEPLHDYICKTNVNNDELWDVYLSVKRGIFNLIEKEIIKRTKEGGLDGFNV